jgi:hypothetical protein
MLFQLDIPIIIVERDEKNADWEVEHKWNSSRMGQKVDKQNCYLKSNMDGQFNCIAKVTHIMLVSTVK